MHFFLQSIDYMQLLYCFITGGIICVIGQILIDKTKLTPARILVIYVTLGAVLGGLGIYQYLVEFAGAGATVPLTGFGYNLAKGAKEAVDQYGFIGAFIGGTKAAAGGIAAAIFFRLYSIPNIKTKNEETIKKSLGLHFSYPRDFLISLMHFLLFQLF